MDPIIKTAWEQATAREQAILSLLPLAKKCAGVRHARMPRSIELDDVEQIAAIGAIKAVDGYRADRGAGLRTFGQRKIHWEITESVRWSDPPVPLPSDPYVSPDYRSLEATIDIGRLITKTTLTGKMETVLSSVLSGATPTEIKQSMGVSERRVFQLIDSVINRLREGVVP